SIRSPACRSGEGAEGATACAVDIQPDYSHGGTQMVPPGTPSAGSSLPPRGDAGGTPAWGNPNGSPRYPFRGIKSSSQGGRGGYPRVGIPGPLDPLEFV